MSSYFPIPPNIFIEDISLYIYGSITFLNIPNNRLKESFFEKKYDSVLYLGLYKLDKNNWILLKVIKCLPFEFCEIKRSELEVCDEEMVILIPKKSKNFPNFTKILPYPDKLRSDKSPVAERCSLNFTFKNSTTSYQGEYPFKMTTLKQSSFLSFDTLKNWTNKKVANYLIFMNILRDSDIRENVLIKVIDPKNKQIKKSIKAKKNAFTIYKITEEKNKKFENPTSFYKSNECSFIPILLSINLENSQLSVEHTHPPSEMVYGINKFDVIKQIKNIWI